MHGVRPARPAKNEKEKRKEKEMKKNGARIGMEREKKKERT